MDKDTLEKMAVTAFANAQVARNLLFDTAGQAIEAKLKLEADKSAANLAGKFDGKNADLREDQARAYLPEQYSALETAEKSERQARWQYDKAALDVDTAKTLLRIAELP
jgi:hypothetical protein